MNNYFPTIIVFCLQQTDYPIMDFGLAIGIFIIVALVLMSLFCVVTRYFNYKLRKALMEQNQIYSLIQGIEGDREDINQGEYEDFVHKRIADKKQRNLEKDKNYKLMLEMTEMKEPLNISDENIYGVSRLKRRLDKDGLPQSVRSLISPKSFKPQKLSNFAESQRSKGSNQNFPSQPQKKKAQITTHKIVEKLVCYTEEGIRIIQCKAKQLWRDTQYGLIRENRKFIQTFITPQELGFDDTLEAFGFQKEIYEAYKFTTTYEIVGMKPHEKYLAKSLKSTEQKEQMEFPSFYIYKDKLEIERTIEPRDKNQIASKVQLG